MNQQLIKELAHFKVVLKQTHAISADLAKLLSDRTYAADILGKAEESNNEDLVVLAIDLKAKLGLLPDAPAMAPPAAAPVEAAAPVKEEETPAAKYVFGTRG